MILLLALLLQSPVAEAPKELVESITAEGVFKHVAELSSDTYEGREAGTAGCDKAAVYLETRLKELKLAPAGPKGSYGQPFKARGKATRNVLGVILGSDPALKKEFVLVGAHYDHIGRSRGGEDPINNGADDNASGTAVALEIARAFASLKERPARSLLFGWWSAEEMGLLGSKFYVENPTLDLKSIVACLNLDMVGRNAEDSIDVEGTGCSPDLKSLFVRINERRIFGTLNFEVERVNPDTDHFWFYKSGIPAVEFFSGYHADYHKPGDESEKITKAKLERVGRFVALAAWDLANAKTRPAFQKVK